jgi:tetratricopeptide (TPR) repeat protein
MSDTPASTPAPTESTAPSADAADATANASRPSPADAARGGPGWVRGLGLFALLLVLALISAAPALTGQFVAQDADWVADNKALRTAAGVQRLWGDIVTAGPRGYPTPQYQPLTATTFWLNYRLGGLNPAVYHVTNVALHALCGLMLWQLLRRLDVPGAALIALLFVVHPMQVQSVSYVAGRAGPLGLLLGLASLYVYLRYAGVIVPPASAAGSSLALPPDKPRQYGLAILLFVLALLSSAGVWFIPFAALLILWWKRGREIDWPQQAAPLIPLAVLAVIAAALTAVMEHARGARGPDFVYAASPIGQAAARLFLVARGVWFYAGKLVFPQPTSFLYARVEPSAAPWQIVFVVGLIAAIVAAAVPARRFGKGPLVALAVALLALVPTTGVFNLLAHRESFVADRFAYAAMPALLALVAGGAVALWRRAGIGAVPGMMVAGVVVLLFAGLSFTQSRAYADAEALWRDTLKKQPGHYVAMNRLGEALVDRADAIADRLPTIADRDARTRELNRAMNLWLEASRHFENAYKAAVKVKERYGAAPLANYARWQYEHGGPEGKVQSLPLFRRALALDPKDPRTLLAFGQVYEQEGRLALQDAAAAAAQKRLLDYQIYDRYFATTLDFARQLYEKAVDADPRNHDAHVRLGRVLSDLGLYADAIKPLERATAIDEDDVQSLVALGQAYLRAGDRVNGVASLMAANDKAPDDPKVVGPIAIALLDQGLTDNAADLLDRFLARNPQLKWAEGHFMLGTVQFQLGRRDQALAALDEALKIDPNNQRYLRARQNAERAPVPAPQPTPK